MGTGKSLQALVAVALAHARYNEAKSRKVAKVCTRSIIVCPSTLVGHWAGEIEKYFPLQSIFTYICLSGNRSERVRRWQQKPFNTNIVVTSYAALRSDIDFLANEKWCYCVLDEGHLLKNPKTGKPKIIWKEVT